MSRKSVRTKKIALVLTLIVFTLFTFLAGCDLGLGNDQETGALSIGLASPRSFDSGLDTEITHYAITLTHTASGTVIAPDPFQKGDPIYFPDLIIGEWTIAVDALNAAGTIVANGSAVTTVAPKSVSNVDIYLSWLDGSGTLDLTMSWTEGAFVGDMFPTAYLVPLDGSPQFDLTLTPGASSATWNQTLDVGLYKLFVNLQDSGEYSNGRVTIINIMSGATTTAAFEFVGYSGDSGVTIIDPEDPLFDMELTATNTMVPINQEVTITASVEDADYYEWYNGTTQLEDSSSYSVVLTTQTPQVVNISCIAYKDSSVGQAEIEITFGEYDPETSMDKYLSAKAILDQAMMNPQETLILDQVYSLLNSAVALNPDNSDAVLALSILDLCGFLIDDDIEVVMQDMLGLEQYPETYADLYANLAQFGLGMVPYNVNTTGFNNILYDYSSEDRFYVILPYLAGWNPSTDGYSPESYLLQMLANLTASGYDADDVVDGILDALGDSLDSVTGNLAGLSDGTRFAISQNTVLGDMLPGTAYYTSAETKAIAAILYQLQSYAYLAKAVDMGFDFNNLLDSMTYDVSTGEYGLTDDFSPFANGFLGIDNEDAAEAVADAKASFLKSLSLMHESMTAIAAREAEGTEDALFISPDNPWYTNSWADISDYLLFADHIVGEIENSVINDVQAIIPLDWIEDCTVINDYVAAEFANWPTEVSMILEDYDDYWHTLPDGCASLGLNFSRLFDPTTSLLSILLELDTSGDIQLYTFDESGYPEAAIPGVDAFDPYEFYYMRIPDVTLNGFLSLEDLPMSIEELNLVMEYNSLDTEETPAIMFDNGDGTISWYWSMNAVSNGLAASYSMYGPYQYPFAYHILTDAGVYTADVPVRMSYGLVEDLESFNYKDVYFDNTMDLTSTGSFWSTLPEFAHWINYAPADQYNDMAMYEMTAENPFQLPMDSAFSIDQWDTVYPMSSAIYFEYTADRDGVVSVRFDSSSPLQLWLNDVTVTDLTNISVSAGETILGCFTSAGDYNWVTCIYDDSLGDISSMGSAYPLAENTTVQGRIYYQLPDDFFEIDPATDRVRIQLDSPDVPSSIQIPGLYSLYHNFYALDQIGSQLYYSSHGDAIEFGVTGITYLVLGSFTGLDYTISWEDIGSPLL